MGFQNLLSSFGRAKSSKRSRANSASHEASSDNNRSASTSALPGAGYSLVANAAHASTPVLPTSSSQVLDDPSITVKIETGSVSSPSTGSLSIPSSPTHNDSLLLADARNLMHLDTVMQPPLIRKKTYTRRKTNILVHQELSKLPSFKDVQESERTELYIAKLHQCCALFDFSDPLSDSKNKEIKRQCMEDIILFLALNRIKFNEKSYRETFKMFAVNCFRTLSPHINPHGEAFDPEDDEPVLEPSWPHMQLAYDVLLRFFDSTNFDVAVARKHLDSKFVLKILALFDSEDPRERDSLKTCLHRIYGKFLNLRPFIRRSISDIFLNCIYDDTKHNGINEFLEILGSIINGFAMPLKEEHKLFLLRVLLPLHKIRSICLFHSQLSTCVSQFLEKDATLATNVITSLLKIWPKVHASKEVMFLTELEDSLDFLEIEEFRKIQIPLIKHLSRCFSSNHFQVAERSLLYFSNQSFLRLFSSDSHSLMPIVFFPLYKGSKVHWSKAITSLMYNALKILMEIDPVAFEEQSANFNENRKKIKEKRLEREREWNRIQLIACQTSSVPEKIKKKLSVADLELPVATADDLMEVEQSSERCDDGDIVSELVRHRSPEISERIANSRLRRKSILPVDESVFTELQKHLANVKTLSDDAPKED